MKDTYLIIAILFLLGSCAPVPLTAAGPLPSFLPPTTTRSATSTVAPSETVTSTITSTVTLTFTETLTPSLTPTIYIPPPAQRPTRKAHRQPTDTATATAPATITPSPTGEPWPTCDHETTSLVLSAVADTVKVGDNVQVTVILDNIGCTMIGMPQYSLSNTPDRIGPVLTPDVPDPVSHSDVLYPGRTDMVEFTLTAEAAGQATLTAVVSYQVDRGTGLHNQGGTSTEPLVITVTP
jgi:hypothetical protein